MLDTKKPSGVSFDAAAKFGRDMCHVVGEVVVLGFMRKHGIALMLIGAGTRAPNDNIFVTTGFNIVQ